MSPRHLRLADPAPIRFPERVSEARIPFSVVDPSGLVAMQEFLAGEGWDVDELLLGQALDRYFEVTEA